MGRDDSRPGGLEHSTRSDAPNPPIYRKLHYEDDDGRGRAVPTKHYTGLAGPLFHQTREDELVQVAHRIRPLLADDAVQVDILTNVPTDLPVDELVSLAEIADPLATLLPDVPEGAVALLEAVHDVVAGDGPDGFRAEALIKRRADGSLANKPKGYHRLARLSGLDVTLRSVHNWLGALENLGLLDPDPDGYEHRAGVSYLTDVATLKAALSTLSHNGGFKVAAIRRFRDLARRADGSLDWLRWAREAFGRDGGLDEWEPPPA